MSGFGLRALKKEVKEKHQDDSRLYFDHIVVGDDYIAALKYLELNRKYPDQTVRLVSSNILNKQSIENEFKCMISTVRSEKAAASLVDKSARLEVTPIDNEPVFYKDTKLHSFSGRAKPHEQMEDEEFFQSSYSTYNWESLFAQFDIEDLDTELLKTQFNKYIDKLEVATPEDLVEKVNFKVFTSEYETFECEHLHWCKSPKAFYKLIANKNDLGDSLHKYCNKLESRTSLTVHFEAQGEEFYDSFGTVFLPQSVTHEWGHFICDIEKYDPATETQEMTALMFVTEEITSEEDLGKKIRLMKRVIERVFSKFAKSDVKEFINYRIDSFIKGHDDTLMDKIQTEHSELHFYGEGAPLGEDKSDVLYTPRAILSL